MFKALMLEDFEGSTKSSIQEIDEASLPEGNTDIDIEYSSLNYKDGLAITGKGKIVKSFPMIPGIDFVGSVNTTSGTKLQQGDKVILTGWGVGEKYWGGISEKARLNDELLVKLPDTLTPEKAMKIGTAGLTAMLCIMALEDNGLMPEAGPVLVTGASGGVGSVSTALLSALGYEVVAVSGRSENTALLKDLGASRIIPRDELNQKGRLLDKQYWAAAIDTVGSQMLANVLSQIQYGGAVAACGLAGGFDLPTSVMPFILRGVSLLGVDSVMCPVERRNQAWQRLATTLPESFYSQACTTISLEKTVEYAGKIVNGKVTGRTIIKM